MRRTVASILRTNHSCFIVTFYRSLPGWRKAYVSVYTRRLYMLHTNRESLTSCFFFIDELSLGVFLETEGSCWIDSNLKHCAFHSLLCGGFRRILQIEMDICTNYMCVCACFVKRFIALCYSCSDCNCTTWAGKMRSSLAFHMQLSLFLSLCMCCSVHLLCVVCVCLHCDVACRDAAVNLSA